MHGFIISKLNYFLFEMSKQGQNEPEELSPSPDDESFPEQVDEVALLSVLVTRCEHGDDPGHNVALWSNALSFKVVADIGVENS